MGPCPAAMHATRPVARCTRANQPVTKRPMGRSWQSCRLVSDAMRSMGCPSRSPSRSMARDCMALSALPMPWPVASAMSTTSSSAASSGATMWPFRSGTTSNASPPHCSAGSPAAAICQFAGLGSAVGNVLCWMLRAAIRSRSMRSRATRSSIMRPRRMATAACAAMPAASCSSIARNAPPRRLSTCATPTSRPS